jgi:hypothetical protein
VTNRPHILYKNQTSKSMLSHIIRNVTYHCWTKWIFHPVGNISRSSELVDDVQNWILHPTMWSVATGHAQRPRNSLWNEFYHMIKQVTYHRWTKSFFFDDWKHVPFIGVGRWCAELNSASNDVISSDGTCSAAEKFSLEWVLPYDKASHLPSLN